MNETIVVKFDKTADEGIEVRLDYNVHSIPSEVVVDTLRRIARDLEWDEKRRLDMKIQRLELHARRN